VSCHLLWAIYCVLIVCDMCITWLYVNWLICKVYIYLNLRSFNPDLSISLESILYLSQWSTQTSTWIPLATNNWRNGFVHIVFISCFWTKKHWNVGTQLNYSKSLFYSIWIDILVFSLICKIFLYFIILNKKSVNSHLPNGAKEVRSRRHAWSVLQFEPIRYS